MTLISKRLSAMSSRTLLQLVFPGKCTIIPGQAALCISDLPTHGRHLPGMQERPRWKASAPRRKRRSHKSYHFFLSRSKEEDIESRGGAISRLSLPDGEMRQHKREIMRELYGKESSRELDTTQRLRLAKEIRRRYNCSLKQISRLVGLSRENLEAFVK